MGQGDAGSDGRGRSSRYFRLAQASRRRAAEAFTLLPSRLLAQRARGVGADDKHQATIHVSSALKQFAVSMIRANFP